MKLLLINFLFISAFASAQSQSNLAALYPEKDYDNITSLLLNADSNVTSVVIWIKHEVKPHYHLSHTEHVYVLEGSGVMLLGEKHISVKPGDLIFIPPNTVHALKVSPGETMKVLSIQAPEFDGKDRIFVEKEW